MRLPILMYHAAGDSPAGVRYPGNFVSRENLTEHLAYLSGEGYQSVSLSSWLQFRNSPAQLPERPIAITFDDGYSSVRSVAWPLLAKFGFTATTFIVTSCVGKTNLWDRDEVPLPLLDEAGIRELHLEGMTFGSHTRSHRGITTLSRDAALEELVVSRNELSSMTGVSVETFAYPYSKYSSDAMSYVRAAGYTIAVRGGGGLNSSRSKPLGLHRIKVDNSLSPVAFRRNVTGTFWDRLLTV